MAMLCSTHCFILFNTFIGIQKIVTGLDKLNTIILIIINLIYVTPLKQGLIDILKVKLLTTHETNKQISSKVEEPL